jgi:hypothetical protein
MKIFKDYTGREPYIEPLLVRRGLVPTDATPDDAAKPDAVPNQTPVKK